MIPCVLELETLLSRGRVGKPKIPVAGLTADTPHRTGYILHAPSHEIGRPSVAGENEDSRRSLSDKQMVITKIERTRDDPRLSYPIPLPPATSSRLCKDFIPGCC